MTVNTTTNRVPYTGDGVSTAFPVNFVFLAAADLKVYQNGVLKTLNTHYTVSGGSGSTGTVTFLTAPVTDDSIVIVRDPAITQLTDLINGDPLPADSVERMSDLLTMVAQRLDDRLDRALFFDDAVVSPPTVGLTAEPEERASTILGFDTDGDFTLLQLSADSLLGSMAAPDLYLAGTDFTPGVTTQLTLGGAPGSRVNTLVMFDGVVQFQDTYTVAGAVITFSSPIPYTTARVEIRRAVPLATVEPSDGSTTFDKLDSAVKNAYGYAPENYGAAGDGVTDDTIAVQNAFTAGAGKTVRLTQTYLVASAIAVSSKTHVSGPGTLKGKNTSAVATGVLVGTGVTGVVVDGIEVNANASSPNGFYHGIHFVGGSKNTVRGCHVHDTLNCGIRIEKEVGTKVIDNSVVDCGRTGFTDNHGIMVFTQDAGDCTDCVVTGNYVYNAFRKGITSYAGSTGVLKRLTIGDNIVLLAGLGGIYCASAPGASQQKNLSIVGNAVIQCGVGIELNLVTSFTLAGNTCELSTSAGGPNIQIDDCLDGTVTGNSSLSSYSDGILIRGNTITPSGIVVSGNSIINSNQGSVASGAGLHFNKTQNCIASGNMILGESGAPKQFYGLLEDGASNYNTFINNFVANFDTAASVTVGASTIKHTNVNGKYGIGGDDPLAAFEINTDFALREQTITLANGANDDVALPTGATTLYVSGPTGAYNLSGLIASTSGRSITIVNYTSFNMTLNHNSGASSAGNRILIGGSADIVLTSFGAVELKYIAAAAAWIVVGAKL